MTSPTYQSKFIKCSKPGCKKCPHGPYWYAFWREGGKVRSKYIGKQLPPDPEEQPELWEVELEPGVTVLADAKQVLEMDQIIAQEKAARAYQVAEAWLLLGYPGSGPTPPREKVRKRVWNLAKRVTITDAQRNLILASWNLLAKEVYGKED